ncbi:MAG: hypothetical protein MR327_03750 [Clostridiales bacterium]|nr:hypothetical protein [Clostridiales bacterium]
MEDMRNEAAREAALKADKARMIKTAQRMLKAGKYTYEDVADVLEISVDEVKALDESQSA